MALIGAIFIFFILFVMDKSRTAKSNKKVEEMKARGEFDPCDYKLHDKLIQDAVYDWAHEHKLYPEEYWAYFEQNPKALSRYICGIVSKQEMDSGHKPVLHDAVYNKYTFDPFGGFNQYKEKIKIFNKTGRMYY